MGSDEIGGKTADGEVELRFDAIRSIERSGPDGSTVTLLDGRELFLSGTRQVGRGHRGVSVQDGRYGRVLISWEAFERVDFSPVGSGPGYEDFPQGLPLTGTVTTRDGRGLVGRLVYDLDESESTETLDAPSHGVDYSILLEQVASILPSVDAGLATVTLHSGEELHLEGYGDLGDGNGGMLIFVEGRKQAEYVKWRDVERVDFDRPAA